MPVVDPMVEKFKDYKGSSPLPPDYDVYWDKALKELDASGLDYELEPAEFSAPDIECYYLYFTGVGGARVCGKFLRPAKIEGKIPGITMFHGYSVNSGSWFNKLPYAYAGYAVLALDVRGQLGRSDDNLVVTGNTMKGHIARGIDEASPDKLFFRNVYLDTAKCARILMSMDFVDEKRIGATGISQGGALTLACAALEPRVKMLAPLCPYMSDFKKIWETNHFRMAYDELWQYIRVKDPRHQRIEELFTRLGYIDISNLVSRIKGETLMFITMTDDVCPPPTQFAIYNKLGGPKSCKIYPDYGHEAPPDSDELIFNFFKRL